MNRFAKLFILHHQLDDIAAPQRVMTQIENHCSGLCFAINYKGKMILFLFLQGQRKKSNLIVGAVLTKKRDEYKEDM